MSDKRHLDLVPPDPKWIHGGSAPPTSGHGEDELMLVGELAKATGKTVRAIHLYEDMGLLRPQDRSKGRYRLFGTDSLVRVRWINKLQSLGLSLSEIQEVVREQEGAETAMFAAARLREVYLEKLAAARAKIEELEALERELKESLSYLDACDSRCEPQIPTDGCSTCERHERPATAPDLVAGAQAQAH